MERMSSFLSMRAILKKVAVQHMPTNMWVADTCCAVPNGAELNSESKLAALRKFLLADGVHLTPEGYRNVSNNISSILDSVVKGTMGKYTPNCPNPTSVSGARRYHWRGFTSPVGSRSQSTSHTGLKAIRGRQPRPHGPYGGSSSGRKGYMGRK